MKKAFKRPYEDTPLPSEDKGDNEETKNVSNTMVKCIDFLLLQNKSINLSINLQDYLDPSLLQPSNESREWKTGKVTEVMEKIAISRKQSAAASKQRLPDKNEEKNNKRTSTATSASTSRENYYQPQTSSKREKNQHEESEDKVKNDGSHSRDYSESSSYLNIGTMPMKPFKCPRKIEPTSEVKNENPSHQINKPSSLKSFSNPPGALKNILKAPNYDPQVELYQKNSLKNTVNEGYKKEVYEKDVGTDSDIDITATNNSMFMSALDVLIIKDKAKGINTAARFAISEANGTNKSLYNKSSSNSKSVQRKDEDSVTNREVEELMKDERLKSIEPKMVENVLNEVIESGASTTWNDIAGLEGVKNIIREIIIWPMLRPDIFTSLRSPPKGILLFGPPGTGKTMIGRLIATESSSTFFNISASSLTSKWIGDGEKMMRALFQVARVKQPSVLFIDEIDSILCQRSDSEHESSRRLKTEFLIQFDGAGTKSDDKILVIGVTNRPQELDEAARRRLVKRIYIPLPDQIGRKQLINNLINGQGVDLDEGEVDSIVELTQGYSGADMASLCKEAAYGPIRDAGTDIRYIELDKVRKINYKDFESALKHVKASVGSQDLDIYAQWDEKFGCHI